MEGSSLHNTDLIVLQVTTRTDTKTQRKQHHRVIQPTMQKHEDQVGQSNEGDTSRLLGRANISCSAEVNKEISNIQRYICTFKKNRLSKQGAAMKQRHAALHKCPHVVSQNKQLATIPLPPLTGLHSSVSVPPVSIPFVSPMLRVGCHVFLGGI